MRKPLVVLTVMVLILGLAGCGETATTTTVQGAGATTTTTPSAEVTTTQAPATTAAPTTTTAEPITTTTFPPPPTAASVWTRIVAGQAYRSWQTAPGHETPQPATGPHGAKDQVFANDIFMQAFEGPVASAWPVGSIIVKDVYNTSGTLFVFEFMQRTDEGWYYASFDSDGQVETEGLEIKGCHGCHGGGSDAVFTFDLP